MNLFSEIGKDRGRVRGVGFRAVHLTHKRPTSDLHNLYMKKRVNTFADNGLFGVVGEWGLNPSAWAGAKRYPAPAIPSYFDSLLLRKLPSDVFQNILPRILPLPGASLLREARHGLLG
jgi:hypothetical protein